MEEERSLVKVEGNLIEYPFFHLGGRKDKIVRCREYTLGEMILDNGLVVKRKLIVKNYEEGIPGPYDQDVLMGVMKIGTDKGKLTEDIPLTVYEVAREIDDLSHRMRVKESIKRLFNTSYTSEQVILVKEGGEKYYLDDLFHILESARFLDKSERNRRRSNKVTKVRFNKFFIMNFLNDYYKYIDLGKYLELRSPVAKKLYMYLEKKKFNKEMYQIKLDNLAGVLPLEVSEYYEIRKVLKRASEKLIGESIIKSFEFKKDNVIYYFTGNGDVKKSEKDKPCSGLVEELVKLGVTRGVAEDLVNKYDAQMIERQLQYIEFRKGDNIPGILVKAISEDWAAPQEYVKKQKEEEDKKLAEKERDLEREARDKREAYEEKMEKVLRSLTEEQVEMYDRKAEEQFRRDNPGSDIKFFARGYRESLIKRFVAEDMGICKE